MKRKASAVWQGNLMEGKGTVSTESGVLNQVPYSFGTRFESGIGTNPEELIAAAHAGCFSMALSAHMGKTGLIPEKISTTAVITFEKIAEDWTITNSHLEVEATVPEVSPETFLKLAQEAKAKCPISRLLNTPITMEAKLSV